MIDNIFDEPSNDGKEETITDINQDGEELTFSELYASIILNGEIIITIPPEEVERVKTGLKNHKAKLSAKMKEEGLVPDPSIFTFIERTPLSPSYKDNFVDLSIVLSRRSSIKIMQMRIPDNEL